MIVLNPARRKSRKGKGKKSRSRSRSAARRRASARRSYRHRRASASGTAARRAVQAIACGPHPYRTIHRLRKKCVYSPPSNEARRRAAVAQYARENNPRRGSRGSIFSNALAGFQPSALMEALPVAAGAYLNGRVTPFIAKSLPAAWRSGWRNLIVATGAAGMALFIPKYGPKLFVGSLTRVLIGGLLPLMEKAWEPPPPPPPPVPTTISAQTANTITNAIASGVPVAPAAVAALNDYEQMQSQMSELPVEEFDGDSGE